MTVARPLADRFWEKVNKNGPVPPYAPDLGPCWVWTAFLHNGYGKFTYDGGTKSDLAHRLAWKLTFGEFPVLHLDHLCRVRACVNPAHLEPVSRSENQRRMYASGERRARARNAATHCRHGHEYTPENTYWPPGGTLKQCRECRREADRRRRIGSA